MRPTDEHGRRTGPHGQPGRGRPYRTRRHHFDDSTYMGSSPYTILESTIIPFVQNHYNVSTDRMDRAFAGLSMARQ